jgi:hypothetical protein
MDMAFLLFLTSQQNIKYSSDDGLECKPCRQSALQFRKMKQETTDQCEVIGAFCGNGLSASESVKLIMLKIIDEANRIPGEVVEEFGRTFFEAENEQG